MFQYRRALQPVARIAATGIAMFSTELPNSVETEPTPEAIREQLELLVQDHVFRSIMCSVQFLRYVVEQTISGSADGAPEFAFVRYMAVTYTRQLATPPSRTGKRILAVRGDMSAIDR